MAIPYTIKFSAPHLRSPSWGGGSGRAARAAPSRLPEMRIGSARQGEGC